MVVSACRPRAWTGLVAPERFTTGEPFRSPVAIPQPVSGMRGGIQTGWLRHAHLIDSDLHSIPVRGAEKPAPVGAGWHARFDGPVLGGWLTDSPSQPTLLADWHYYGVGSHTSKAFRNHGQPDCGGWSPPGRLLPALPFRQSSELKDGASALNRSGERATESGRVSARIADRRYLYEQSCNTGFHARRYTRPRSARRRCTPLILPDSTGDDHPTHDT